MNNDWKNKRRKLGLVFGLVYMRAQSVISQRGELFRRRLVTVLAPVVLIGYLLFTHPTIVRANLTAEEIVTAQSQYFARIQSIDVIDVEEQTQSMRENGNANHASRTIRDCVHTRISGSKFRVDTGLDDSIFPPRAVDGGEIVAFDLQKHQYFDKSKLSMSVQISPSAHGYIANIAFLQPFAPVIPAVNLRTFDALKSDSKIWTAFASVAKIGQMVQFAGHQCLSVDIFGDPGLCFRWYLAEDLSFYPIGYENFHANGAVASKYVVSEIQAIQTQQGDVRLPIKATWDWYAETGTPTMHFNFVIDTRSIGVNKAINDQAFIIHPTLALSYQDRDDPSKCYAADQETRRLQSQITDDMSSNKTGNTSDQIIGEASVSDSKDAGHLEVVIISVTAIAMGVLLLLGGLWILRSRPRT